MTTLIRKMLLAVAFLGALMGASATATVAMAQEDRSTMSQDWGSSEDFQSTQQRAIEQDAAAQRYLLQENLLGNTTNIDGDYVNNTTNTGPVTSSSAMNVGQYSSNNLEVGDNSMATVTIGTDQDGSQQQEATSTVTSTGNTSNVYPN